MAVVKSTGRKDANFDKLINYLFKEDGGELPTFTYLHNIIGVDPEDREALVQAFVSNDTHRKKRKNGNAMYHDMISFHPKDSAYIKKNPHVLEDMTRVYLEFRAPHGVALAKPHLDKEHIHIHVMLSANERESATSLRRSKQEFLEIQQALQEYQVGYHPGLKYSYVAERDKEKYVTAEKAERVSHKLWQMEKRGVGTPDKDQVRELMTQVVAQAKNAQELKALVQKAGGEVYEYRDKMNGVRFNGKKYRFTTLLGKKHAGVAQLAEWNKFRKEASTEQQSTADAQKKEHQPVEEQVKQKPGDTVKEAADRETIQVTETTKAPIIEEEVQATVGGEAPEEELDPQEQEYQEQLLDKEKPRQIVSVKEESGLFSYKKTTTYGWRDKEHVERRALDEEVEEGLFSSSKTTVFRKYNPYANKEKARESKEEGLFSKEETTTYGYTYDFLETYITREDKEEGALSTETTTSYGKRLKEKEASLDSPTYTHDQELPGDEVPMEQDTYVYAPPERDGQPLVESDGLFPQDEIYVEAFDQMDQPVFEQEKLPNVQGSHLPEMNKQQTTEQEDDLELEM